MADLIAPDGDRRRTATVDPASYPQRGSHSTVLLTWPAHLEPTGVATDEAGGRATEGFRREAYEQWRDLREAYESIDGIDVRTMNPLAVWDSIRDRDDVAPPERLPDIVFCANVALPWPDEDRVLLSRMAAESRADEPEYAAAWFEANGYDVERLSPSIDRFEGTGDAIWHPDRRLLWGGVGERTAPDAYDEIARLLDVDVLTLDPAGSIDGETFFHLDIVFSPLDERTALLVPEVFDEDDLAAIRTAFDRVIECPFQEAKPSGDYAANAYCPDGEHVLVQQTAEGTIELLDDAGYTPVPVETRAFIDGCAGSVFCLKLALP